MEKVEIELRHITLSNNKTIRLYLIQRPRYGTSLSVYINLYNKAKEYFPDLKEDGVSLGVVKNTGFMDNHAVLSFLLPEGVELPEDFKHLMWEPEFKW